MLFETSPSDSALWTRSKRLLQDTMQTLFSISSGAATPPLNLPVEEVVRQQRIRKTKLWVRLLLDGRVVGSTEELNLTNNLVVPFSHHFAERMPHKVRVCRLQILQRAPFRCWGTIVGTIDFPCASKSISQVYITQHEMLAQPTDDDWFDKGKKKQLNQRARIPWTIEPLLRSVRQDGSLTH